QCARTNRHWQPGMARAWIGRHSEMALQDEPLSSCICAHRLWHRPLSGSHLHCQPRARLDSLAPVLDCLLRRSLYLRGRKLRHWMPAAVGGFRCGTDVRALDRNNSRTACSQLLPHPRRTSRPGQVVGRVHCRSALVMIVRASGRSGKTNAAISHLACHMREKIQELNQLVFARKQATSVSMNMLYVACVITSCASLIPVMRPLLHSMDNFLSCVAVVSSR